MTTENTTYTPVLADLSAIVLPEGLTALGELIAEHVHDEWAVQRIKDGWTYGPKRDDDKKHHPCLVSYGDLPDSERTYDRNTATATLQLVIAKGYKLVKCDE